MMDRGAEQEIQCRDQACGLESRGSYRYRQLVEDTAWEGTNEKAMRRDDDVSSELSSLMLQKRLKTHLAIRLSQNNPTFIQDPRHARSVHVAHKLPFVLHFGSEQAGHIFEHDHVLDGDPLVLDQGGSPGSLLGGFRAAVVERFSISLDVGLVGRVPVDPAILGLLPGGLLVLLGKGVPGSMRHVQDGLFFMAVHIVLVDPFNRRLLPYRRLVRPTQFELFLRGGKVNVRPRISRKVGMGDIIRLTERKLGGLMDPFDGVHVDMFEIVIQGHP
jgi:hypothetical protein